jgi:hypothetical protein
MWVVVRNIVLTSFAFMSMALFLGFGPVMGRLIFADSSYPLTNDMELAIGCGLIAAMAAFCLVRDMFCRGVTTRFWERKS